MLSGRGEGKKIKGKKEKGRKEKGRKEKGRKEKRREGNEKVTHLGISRFMFEVAMWGVQCVSSR